MYCVVCLFTDKLSLVLTMPAGEGVIRYGSLVTIHTEAVTHPRSIQARRYSETTLINMASRINIYSLFRYTLYLK